MAFIPSISITASPTTTRSPRCRRRHHAPAKYRSFRMTSASETSESSASAVASQQTLPTTIHDFMTSSLGTWSGQRSSHTLAWAQFEAVTSEIEISQVSPTDPVVEELYKQYDETPSASDFAFKMAWEGETDWDETETSGEAVMVVIKDNADGEEEQGRLLRNVGYAETIPAVGKWRMRDGVFLLETSYDAASAEEKIWFATPDLRMRVSNIRTSSGKGVVTASFATEIRR